MTKFFKMAVFSAAFLFVLSFAATPVLANDPFGFDYADNLGLSNTDVQDPRDMAVNIVQFFMTFLGIIAVVIILYGGFLWMTAAGNEDKVATAKKVIIAGAIGLAVIIAAYVIVNFVITTTNSIIINGTPQY
jgi:heme/copper-type cytochrome/quinol oxidase subunit 2